MPYPRPAPRSRLTKCRLRRKEEMPVSNMTPCIPLGAPGLSWEFDCDSQDLTSEDYRSHGMPVGRFAFSSYSEEPGYSCHSETVTKMDDAPSFPMSPRSKKVEQQSIIVDQTTGFSYRILGEPVRSPGKEGRESASAGSDSSAFKEEIGRKGGGEEDVTDILDKGTALVEDDAHLLLWLEQEWEKGYDKDLFNILGTLPSQFTLNREIEHYLESISRNSDASYGAYGGSFVDAHSHINGTCDASLIDCPSQGLKLADYNSNEIFEKNTKERETRKLSFFDSDDSYDIFSNDLFSYPGMSDASTFDTSGKSSSSSTTLEPTNDGCPILRQRLSVSAESAHCLPVGVKDQCEGAVHVEFQAECGEWLAKSKSTTSEGFQADPSKRMPDFRVSGIGVYSDNTGLVNERNAAVACFSVGAGLPPYSCSAWKSAFDSYESKVCKNYLPPPQTTPLSSVSIGSGSTCPPASKLPFKLSSPSLFNHFSSPNTVTLIPVQTKIPGPKHILNLPEAMKQGLRIQSMAQVPPQLCMKNSNYSVNTSSSNTLFKSAVQERQTEHKSPNEPGKENELEVFALDSPKIKNHLSPRKSFSSQDPAMSQSRASTGINSYGDLQSQEYCAKSKSLPGFIKREKTFTVRQHLKGFAEGSSDTSQKDKNECQEWVKIFRKVNAGADTSTTSELIGKNVGKELYENSESGIVIQFSSPPRNAKIHVERNDSSCYASNRNVSKEYIKTKSVNVSPGKIVSNKSYEDPLQVEKVPLEVKTLKCKEAVVVLRDLYSGKKQKSKASTSVREESSDTSEITNRVQPKSEELKSEASSGNASTPKGSVKFIKSTQKTAEKKHKHITQKRVQKCIKKDNVRAVKRMDPIELLKEEGVRNMWKHVIRLKSLMLNSHKTQSSTTERTSTSRGDNKVATSPQNIARQTVLHQEKSRENHFKWAKDKEISKSEFNSGKSFQRPEIASKNVSRWKKVTIKKPAPHRLVKVLPRAAFMLHQSSFLPSACKPREQKIVNDYGTGKRESLHRSCKLPLKLVGYY